MGEAYAKGLGVARDGVQAVKWYRKAAEQGNAYAQLELSSMYRNGLGVAKDDEQAFAWRRKAAEQENYDVRNAIELHDTRSRAEQGNAVAQFNLGVMYISA